MEEGNPKKLKDTYNVKSDIWSVGMIAYFMFYRSLPFKSDMEDIDAIKNEILSFQISLGPSPGDLTEIDFFKEIVKR